MPSDAMVRSLIGPAPDPAVYIHRTDVDHYEWYQPAGLGRYWHVYMVRANPPNLPGNEPNQPLRMGDRSLDLPILSLDQTAASFAYGGTWNAATSLSGTYGGTWRATTVAGSTMTWTSPACESIILRGVTKSDGGLAKVTIDGSATAATALPTAQDVVTSGAFANTILVANGGTLAPTDRVYDGYSSTVKADLLTLFADGLTSGVHTVVMTFTGYANAAASGTLRMGVSGFSYADVNLTPATSGVTMFVGPQTPGPTSTIASYAHRAGGTDGGAEEISFLTHPTSGGPPTWAGGVHGYELESSSTLTIDGTVRTMTNGQTLAASVIAYDRDCDLFHPNLGGGTTPYASDNMSFVFDEDGLHFTHTTTWLASMTVDASYPFMMNWNAANSTEYVDRYSQSGVAVDYPLDLDNNQFLGKTPSVVQWTWKNGGHVCGSFDCLSEAQRLVATNNDTHAAPNYEFAWDADNGPFDKMYVSRNSLDFVGALETAVNGNVWTGECLWRCRWLASTAALSALAPSALLPWVTTTAQGQPWSHDVATNTDVQAILHVTA